MPQYTICSAPTTALEIVKATLNTRTGGVGPSLGEYSVKLTDDCWVFTGKLQASDIKIRVKIERLQWSSNEKRFLERAVAYLMFRKGPLSSKWSGVAEVYEITFEKYRYDHDYGRYLAHHTVTTGLTIEA